MSLKTSKPFILLVLLAALAWFGFNQVALTSTKPSPISPQSSSIYTTKTIIIADMGSTGSRMHAYEIKQLKSAPSNAIPEIKEIATSTSQDNMAIANYCKNPKAIVEHITPIYHNLADSLKEQDIDIKNTPIYIFATAGMRLYPIEKQKIVYKQLKNNLIALGHNGDIVAKTIPGELEGIFDWLSVNYKLKTIQDKKPTVAALDMGGASTQIAMEYDAPSSYKAANKTTSSKQNNAQNLPNIYTIKFKDKNYNIYSQSILGYGLVQTKKEITNYNPGASQSTCSISNSYYVQQHYEHEHEHIHEHQLGFDANIKYNNILDKNKSTISDFNFTQCGKLIKSYLKNKKEHAEASKVINKAIKKNMTFIAFSGYYYKFKIFNSQQPEDLIKNIPDSCHLHRKEFKKKYPHLTEAELNETCFDATYLKVLLTNAYNIPDDYHNFIIPKHDIDWTIGASLFISTNQSLDLLELP